MWTPWGISAVNPGCNRRGDPGSKCQEARANSICSSHSQGRASPRKKPEKGASDGGKVKKSEAIMAAPDLDG